MPSQTQAVDSDLNNQQKVAKKKLLPTAFGLGLAHMILQGSGVGFKVRHCGRSSCLHRPRQLAWILITCLFGGLRGHDHDQGPHFGGESATKA